MQQFTIPQFIDVEAKIMGPITTRQFVLILFGAIVGAISYRLFDFSLFLTASILTFIMVGLFGFAKINSRPFHLFVLNFIQTIKKPKLRVWNNAKSKTETSMKEDEIAPKPEEVVPVKHYTTSRLAELSLIVDTGGAYKGEDAKEGSNIKSV